MGNWNLPTSYTLRQNSFLIAGSPFSSALIAVRNLKQVGVASVNFSPIALVFFFVRILRQLTPSTRFGPSRPDPRARIPDLQIGRLRPPAEPHLDRHLGSSALPDKSSLKVNLLTFLEHLFLYPLGSFRHYTKRLESRKEDVEFLSTKLGCFYKLCMPRRGKISASFKKQEKRKGSEAHL